LGFWFSVFGLWNFYLSPNGLSTKKQAENQKPKTKTMYILGISAFYHDSAACLIRDGEILAAAQEERFTRKKHDADFPKNAVDYCLKHAGITVDDLDFVAFYDKPLLTFERLLETYIDYAPRGLKSFLKAMPVWLKDKLWTRENIAKALNYEGKILFTEHHESHAASAFFASPFENAAVVTMDGVGEWATTSYGHGKGNELHLLKELHFPHSIGLLYSAFTYYLGFKVNSGEYKVMGLAPYGEPIYTELILDELVELYEDGSLRLNMKYFNFAAGLTMTNAAFEKLFGEPRREPESELRQIHLDLARSVQEVTELAMVKIARHVQKETGEKNLCLAGGVALNCVGNGRILREKIFENIWIQPAAGDAGGALGAALSVWHQYLGNERSAANSELNGKKNYYLGPKFSNDEITEYLDSVGANYQKLSRTELYETVAQHLADEKVVGWFQGRMEFGPRALGGRSILGDARSPKMQTQMNLKIKFRESFRPFAPSVLREKVSDFFELETDSPYMLLVAPVRENLRFQMSEDEQKLFGIEKLNLRRSTIPAVTHIDYSARIQTVREEESPAYHKLISAFDDLTGCPVVVNTSFNVRGEPIVCTPRDAYRCFMKTEMDFLVMEDILLDKRTQNGNSPLEEKPEQKTKPSETEQVSNKQARNTALVVAAVLFLFAAWNFYRLRETAAIVFIGLSAFFVLLGTLLPTPAKIFHVYWMKLARVLGHVNSIILLTLLFYLVFAPYNLISRVLGRDPLRRRGKKGESNWTERKTTRQSKERFERLF
jgi:carbamoyltransferase